MLKVLDFGKTSPQRSQCLGRGAVTQLEPNDFRWRAPDYAEIVVILIFRHDGIPVQPAMLPDLIVVSKLQPQRLHMGRTGEQIGQLMTNLGDKF